MVDPLWKLTNIVLGDRKPRLQVESLIVPAGVTAVMGVSGAGKTSLLNLLAGFEKPRSGVLELCGASRTSDRLPVFWVPAEAAFWPHLTVQGQLDAVRPESMPSSIIESALQRFELYELRANNPAQLSLGEQARLSLLRGLIAQSDVLLVDEPLANVDHGRRRVCWEALVTDQQRRGSHLVFATHQPELVLAHASHVICLQQGEVLWTGSVPELYNRPPTQQVAEFLGPVNWFEARDVQDWLGTDASAPVCLRPERTQVLPDPQGPFQVLRARFLGSQEEVTLDHPRSGIRTVLHRPARPLIKQGMLASLKTLLALLAICLPVWCAGCTNSSEGAPVLDVTPLSHRPLPPEGIMLPAPRGMTYSPENELYVLDNAGRILVYNSAGEVLRQWWMPEYSVGKPERACILKDGRIAIADTHYNRIVFFSQQGEVLEMLGSFGEGPGQFIYTVAVTQDDQGHLYVAEYGGNDRIQKFTIDGQFLMQFGSMGTDPGQFQRPSGMFWHEGLIYVADAINNRIQVFDENGKFIQILADAQSARLHYPYDVALAPDETIYIAEYGAGRVSRISLDGKLLGQFGKEGRRLGEFWTPWGIAVSPEGRIAVADTGNRRLVELEP